MTGETVSPSSDDVFRILDVVFDIKCSEFMRTVLSYVEAPTRSCTLKVYDVTKFLEDHPGGDDVLLSATGKDATDDFEDVGHSSSARAMMDEFHVGDIDTATIPSKVNYTPPKQPHYNQDKTSEFVIKLLQFLVPLIILGVAVGIRFYTKSA
ncbi:Cytochrome b5 [Vitis vinifera]|uniref:Cytochrome b5 n=1 Tax=Vitis vinifera TaxID=29760 RepID=A0A438C786_VITVI|nr:Cytochrome b5 [Vitis vinifera]